VSALGEVRVTMNSSRVIAETSSEEGRMILAKAGVQTEFGKDERGRFCVHVRGKGDEKELREEGERILGRIKQMYAYQRIMQEMKKRGYLVTSETVEGDHRIRIRLERFA